ncbi:probable ATP-dependent RNA helicase DDX52 [Eurytemora carolleeae]|uniref:probable ATP-dependent RNA helicase DDX52 n=1 Tax=Eurytemora carolleeae TaxID=1294199 RepID=UPI000C78F79B|nr:probable ATP-dependent RNA helicase DDX52 [Eurytemora carolleeae]|eukprot:XP_023330370.1 probable ATP-dependent RNA helicase DDX52 [Eurytemora affinis]
MSVSSIFKQLTSGVNFNTNLYKNEAKRFGLVKDTEATVESAPTLLPSYKEVKEEVVAKGERDNQSSDEEDLTIIGNITTMKKKKKKKKEKKEQDKIKEIYAEKVNHFRNANKIHVQGSDIPTPISEWIQLCERYSVSENLFNNISYNKPSPVQMQTIPLMLENREVLSCAPTGSGKTAAFLIPILHSLKAPINGGYRAVIIVPTKELAVQIEQECKKLCTGTGLRPYSLGKVKSEKTKPDKVKHDILISPPNRLVYMINHDPPLINLSKVQWLIIDEADKLFEAGVSGFREQLATIYTSCNGPGIRRGMFSATLGQEVQGWCKLNLDNLVSVRVGAANSATETIEQKLLYCGSEHGKLVAFRALVLKGLTPPVLIFVQTKERAQELFKELLYDGIHVDVIHSDRSQQQRENTVRAFRSGGIWVLICTELMGRGIDFKGVNLVINYDFPPSAVSYIHRIGRTGRAGRSGSAITFFTESDRPVLKSIAQVMRNSGCEVPEYMLLLKTSRDVKKQIENNAPKRDSISRESKFDKARRLKRNDMVKASKKRKQREEGGGNDKEEKKSKKPKIDSTSTNTNTDKKIKKKKKSLEVRKSLKKEKKTMSSDKEHLEKKKKAKIVN